jgi:hypothetical protein
MTLLEQASLVFIPSGYKEGKAYSIIPSNGDGDLSFGRTTEATRINSDGLIETMPWNLFQQSETFENASWTKNNISVATGIGTTPEGLPYRILTNTVNGFNHLTQTPPLIVNSFYSVTIVLKKGTAISVGFRIGAGTWGDAKYNFDTDAFVGSGVAFASRRFLGDGWIEIKYQNFEALQTNFRVFISSSTTGNSLDGLIGQTLLVSKMQISVGSTAKPYFPTTDRLNVPRLTYQNGGGGCPSLLLEPQRTNVLTYSQDLSNVLWEKNGVTVSLSSTDFLTLEKSYLLSETTASSTHILGKPTVVTIGVINTYSIYFKKGTGSSAPDIIRLRSLWSDAYVNFNIVTGTKLFQSGSVISATITADINGWFRCTMTYSGSTSSNNQFYIQFVNNTNTSVTNLSYVGNVNADVFVAGGQNEVGSYASSYIPTTSASATRIADACSKTGISSLIGQTEGTLFAEFIPSTNTDVVNLSANGAFQTELNISYDANNRRICISFYVNPTYIIAYCSPSNSAPLNTRIKVAVGYKSGDLAIYINGVQRNTSTTTYTIVSPLTRIRFNQNNFTGSDSILYNQVIVFKTRLTNSELVTLTTL